MMHRQLRYEPLVEEQLRKLKVEVRRFDEMMESIEDVLASSPQAFPSIPGTKLSFCRTNEFVGTNFRGVPSLSIYFHYDAHCVYIISVEESQDESYGF